MEKLKISRKEIVRLYRIENLTLREIAKKAGVTHQNIYFHLSNLGVKRRTKGSKKNTYPRYDFKLMRDLYVEQGLSMAEIGRRQGVSRDVIKRELQLHGIETGRWTQLTPENRAKREKAVELYEKGWRVREIADRLDRSTLSIYKLLGRAGIKLGEKQPLDRKQLKLLYVSENKPVKQICRILGVSKDRLERELIKNKIPLRKGDRVVKHPELAGLKVGQSAVLPRKSKLNYHKIFYDDARRLGIQVRVERIDQKEVRVWRTL